MHYYFDKKINNNTVNELVEKLEDKEQVKLYFETEGGETDAMDFLIDFLNSRKEHIEIVVSGCLMSAGTFVLTDFEGKITLNSNLDVIMFHKVDREVYTLRKSSFIDTKKLVQQSEAQNKKFSEKLKNIGLTEKQIKKFNRGEDIILYQKDFNQLKLNNNN